GVAHLPDDFWETHSREMESWQEAGRTFYRLRGPLAVEWHPNQCIFSERDDSFEARVVRRDGDEAIIEVLRDYRSQRNAVWGINARNREQNFALNLLLDPDVDFVTLLGAAGTGKTLLALAAGLAQTLEK